MSGITRTLGRMSDTLGQIAGIAGILAGSRYGVLIGQARAGSWLASLQPASYRGLSFAVDTDETSVGRRNAIHLYPRRDDIYPEDMGRAPRTYNFSGFVCGDDCFAQAQALRDAAETYGPGQLIHPWLGSVLVSQAEPVRMLTSKERGGVVELRFSFIECPPQIGPIPDPDTGGAVDAAANGLDTASVADFGDAVAGGVLGQVVQQGAAVVQAGAGVVQGFVDQANLLVGDASLIVHAVTGLPAPSGYDYGLYATGARGVRLTGVGSVDQAIGAITQAREAVAITGSAAIHLSLTL